MSTEKPLPLRGYRETQETQKDNPVDPNRFKEELSKVSESDEAQKRNQRNSKKAEEEPDDDAAAGAPIAASGDLFSLFMNDSSDSGLLSPQTPQNIKSTEAPSSSSQFTIEEDPSAASPQPSGAPPELPPSMGGIQAPSPSSSNTSQPLDNANNPPSPTPSQSPTPQTTTAPDSLSLTYPTAPTLPGTEDTPDSSATSTPSPVRVTKKTTQDTSLLAKKAPSAAQLLKQQKEISPAEIKLQKPPQQNQAAKTPTPPATTPSPPTQRTAPTPLKAPLQPPAVKPPLASPLQEAVAAAPPLAAPVKPPLPTGTVKTTVRPPSQGQALAQELTTQSTKTHSDTPHDHSKDKDHQEDNAASITPVIPITPFIPTPTVDAPAYTNLAPQIYDLFEKMVGLMTIEQSHGITTTTVTINMKDSIFDGAKIVLDHYSTAPNSFNVTIAGSPEAQALVNANIGDLVAAFEQSKLSFQVNLRRPILSEEYQAVKRKGKVGDEDEEKKQK